MPKTKFLFNKITIILLALQILNLSIYNTDFYIHSFLSPQEPTQSQIDDQNSIDCFAEMVVEDMAGYQNAFPETPQKTTKQRGELKHNINFKLFQIDNFAKVVTKTGIHYSPYKEKYPLFLDHYSYLFVKEINHPPA